jgi:adenosylhomocysteine nucleosidase
MIGIISAMQEEMQTLLQNLQEPITSTKGMRTYYSGKLFNIDVVLVFSRWGKVASATTVTQLINDYNIDEIIFTGVAGAISKDLNIGDIVIGKHLYQHDIDASPLFKKFEVPLLNKTYFETSATHRAQLYKATQMFLNSYSDSIDTEMAQSFKIASPKVIISDIASGDQFISDTNSVLKLTTELSTVSCVEMEGAAVAQVCYEYNIPFSIIRIISDKANDNAHIDFSKFAKEIASHYALGVLKEYFKLII